MLELSLGSVFAHRFVIEKRMQSRGLGLIFRTGDRQTNRDVTRKLLQGESHSIEVKPRNLFLRNGQIDPATLFGIIF